jgi:hypothetical protein
LESKGWQRLVVNEGLFVKYRNTARQLSSVSGGLILFWFSITFLLYFIFSPAKIDRADASWTASATVIAGSAAVVVNSGEVAEVTGSEVMVMAGIGGIEN